MYFIASLILVFGLTATFSNAILTIVYSLITVKSISITISAVILGFVLTVKFLRFIFKKGGGNELIYNMDSFYTDIVRDGNTLPITRNVVIKDSTYQLGIGRDYKIILEGIVENYLEEYEYL